MLNQIFGELYTTHIGENNRLERIWKLAQVDFKKRYYNDKFGILWALVNPLSQVAIYYFVFVRIFGRNEENYVLYLYGAIIIWMAFTEAANRGSHLLKQKRYLIENIQFDWMDLYYSHIISVLLGFFFNMIIYFVISIPYRNTFGEYWYLFPLVLLSWALISLSCGIILCLVRSVFDDAIHIWNIITKFGFWASGIFFPGVFLLENYTWVAYANPFVGIIMNVRACLLVNNEFYFQLFFWNLLYGFILFFIARALFYRYSKNIVEKL